MALSRLRLRLAAGFAVAMLAGLGTLDITLYEYLNSGAIRRLDDRLRSSADGLVAAITREYGESGGSTLGTATKAALEEWPRGNEGFVVLAPDGHRAGALEPVVPLPSAIDSLADSTFPRPSAEIRVVHVRHEGVPAFSLAAFESTAEVRAEAESLALWLLASAPITLLLSLTGGYLLARRALAPFDTMALTLSEMAPGDLERRLPVAAAPDELDRLATQVNALLERLYRSQQQTRSFLQQAAHQLRTPLTVVRGESALALDRTRTAEAYRQALGRIHLASEQMTRRVEELFLLARAEAGERPPLGLAVELDAVALEAADVMRGRAQLLTRRLELGRVDAVEIRGNPALLREAAIELIENACRHGTGNEPVRISAYASGGFGRLEVSNDGPPIEAGSAGENGRGGHLGLSILGWIATTHGGSLRFERTAEINLVAIEIPLAPSTSEPQHGREASRFPLTAR
ncbi:MAG: HAMP domain-containing sensor histidine kinase [Gemmatimonadota bacterium]